MQIIIAEYEMKHCINRGFGGVGKRLIHPVILDFILIMNCSTKCQAFINTDRDILLQIMTKITMCQPSPVSLARSLSLFMLVTVSKYNFIAGQNF